MMHTAEGTEVAGFIYFQGKISLLAGIFFFLLFAYLI